MPIPILVLWIGAALLGGAATTAAARSHSKTKAEDLEARVAAVRKRRGRLAEKISAKLSECRQRMRDRCAATLEQLQIRIDSVSDKDHLIGRAQADAAVAEALALVPAVTFEMPKIGKFEFSEDNISNPADFALSPLGGPVWLILTAAGAAIEFVHDTYVDWKAVVESESEVERIEAETGDLENRLPELIAVPIAKYESTVTHSTELAGEWLERFDRAGLHMTSSADLDADAKRIVGTLVLLRDFIQDAVEVEMKEW